MTTLYKLSMVIWATEEATAQRLKEVIEDEIQYGDLMSDREEREKREARTKAGKSALRAHGFAEVREIDEPWNDPEFDQDVNKVLELDDD